MLICEECGELIEDYDYLSTITEPHGEVLEVCPRCNSTDIAEARMCKSCDEYYASDFLDDGWCDKCKADIRKQFSLIVQEFYIKLSNELKVSVEQVQELVNDMFDGEEIC